MREIIREIVYYGNWVLLLAIMIMIVMYLYRIIRALISGNTDRIKINLLLGAIGLINSSLKFEITAKRLCAASRRVL